MIVILIIIMLTQLGSVGSLFRQKERSQTEEISVQILGRIDEEKVNALLGKTQEWDIVRKRKISMTIGNPANEITAVSRVNLAKSPDDLYETEKWEKTWQLPELTWAWYACTGTDVGTALDTISTVSAEFFWDKIVFTAWVGAAETPLLVGTNSVPHIVLKLRRNQAFNELHIDRRTGLTYMQIGKEDNVYCN